MVTGVWEDRSASGITMTAMAYERAMPYGDFVLLACTIVFAVSALFSYSYYGRKRSFLFDRREAWQMVRLLLPLDDRSLDQ